MTSNNVNSSRYHTSWHESASLPGFQPKENVGVILLLILGWHIQLIYFHQLLVKSRFSICSSLTCLQVGKQGFCSAPPALTHWRREADLSEFWVFWDNLRTVPSSLHTAANITVTHWYFRVLHWDMDGWVGCRCPGTPWDGSHPGAQAAQDCKS